jgi:hypothetical protein
VVVAAGWAFGAGGVHGWYALRLVWVSYGMHDVSPAADATPLWIPQIAMALGCIGFALSLADALVSAAWAGASLPPRWTRSRPIEASHVEWTC